MSTDKKLEEVLKEKVEEVKPQLTKVELQKAEQERIRNENIMRKRAADELANYKKRIRSSNELKELQVHELELNIAYYKNKKEWMDLTPKMEELEVQEKAIQQKAMEDRKKEYEAQQKALEDEKNEKSKIVVPKVGKAREKK